MFCTTIGAPLVDTAVAISGAESSAVNTRSVGVTVSADTPSVMEAGSWHAMTEPANATESTVLIETLVICGTLWDR